MWLTLTVPFTTVVGFVDSVGQYQAAHLVQADCDLHWPLG